MQIIRYKFKTIQRIGNEEVWCRNDMYKEKDEWWSLKNLKQTRKIFSTAGHETKGHKTEGLNKQTIYAFFLSFLLFLSISVYIYHLFFYLVLSDHHLEHVLNGSSFSNCVKVKQVDLCTGT